MALRDGILRFQGWLAGRLQHALRHSVRLKSFLYRILWRLPESWRRSDPEREALKSVRIEGRAVRFVNIGANDGLAGDPLREFIVTRGWTGILVEPVPFVFERLKRAYSGMRGVTCENAAIAEVSGARPFWYLRENRVLPPGYDQVGSFDKGQVLKHEQGLFPGLTPYLASREVPCLSVADLLAKHGMPAVDVYVIDTEGYDAQIVKQIDLDRDPPLVILYEHAHVAEKDRLDCEARLKCAGYALTVDGGNTIAVRDVNPVSSGS